MVLDLFDFSCVNLHVLFPVLFFACALLLPSLPLESFLQYQFSLFFRMNVYRLFAGPPPVLV